jgi:hypothetical protein
MSGIVRFIGPIKIQGIALGANALFGAIEVTTATMADVSCRCDVQHSSFGVAEVRAGEVSQYPYSFYRAAGTPERRCHPRLFVEGKDGNRKRRTASSTGNLPK